MNVTSCQIMDYGVRIIKCVTVLLQKQEVELYTTGIGWDPEKTRRNTYVSIYTIPEKSCHCIVIHIPQWNVIMMIWWLWKYEEFKCHNS